MIYGSYDDRTGLIESDEVSVGLVVMQEARNAYVLAEGLVTEALPEVP